MQQRKRPQSVSFKNKTEKSEKDPEKFKEKTHTHTHTSIFSLKTILKKVSGSLVGYLKRRSRMSVGSTPLRRVLGLDAISKQSNLGQRLRNSKWKRKIMEETVYIETRFTESVAVSFKLSHSGSHVHVVFANIVAFFFSFFQVSLLLLLFLFIY